MTTHTQRRLNVTADCFLTSHEFISDVAVSRSPDCHLCVSVINQQQVRRCRHNWISSVRLVTGAGHGTRRNCALDENLLCSWRTANEFRSQFTDRKSRSILTCLPCHVCSSFHFHNNISALFLSSSKSKSKTRLVYQYPQADWLLFKMDKFPLYNNRNSKLQKH